MPCHGVSAFARLDPPSFRDPVARRSMPLERAIQYGKEIDDTRYVTTTARRSSTRLEYGDAGLHFLQDRREGDSVAARLRRRRRRRLQRSKPARATACARRAATPR